VLLGDGAVARPASPLALHPRPDLFGARLAKRRCPAGCNAGATPMNPIRIHLGPLPEMLRSNGSDLLSAEHDMLVTGCSKEAETALGDAREVRADVLITEDIAGAGSKCLEAILAPAPLTVFAVSADGRGAAAVSLVRRTVELERGSGPALASSIRDLARNPDEVPPGPGSIAMTRRLETD